MRPPPFRPSIVATTARASVAYCGPAGSSDSLTSSLAVAPACDRRGQGRRVDAVVRSLLHRGAEQDACDRRRRERRPRPTADRPREQEPEHGTGEHREGGPGHGGVADEDADDERAEQDDRALHTVTRSFRSANRFSPMPRTSRS